MPDYCPECGDGDHVQKVSAIVASGQSSSGYSTHLAQMLAPYSRPDTPTFPCSVYPLSAIALFLVYWTFAMNEVDACGSSIIIFCLILVAVAISKHQTRKSDFPNQLRIWQESMHIWDRLYYCHKHDIVFDPTTGGMSNSSVARGEMF